MGKGITATTSGVGGVGSGTAYTEDVITADPIVGTATLMERDDQLANVTPAEADWIGLRGTQKGALWVAIADASGDPLTSFGGGTQYNTNVAYADGNTGTIALTVRDDSLTTLTEADGDFSTLRVSSTGALHVTGGGGGTEYTEDQITANPIVGTATLIERDDVLTTAVAEADWLGMKGTAEGALWVQDFNSDALLSDSNAIVTDLAAIEVLLINIDSDTNTIQSDTTAIKASVDVMDDWDEANRAKVNLIVGSAGITGGAGAVAVSTPRFTLASDDPAVALLGTIDTDTGAMVTDLAAIEVLLIGIDADTNIIRGAVATGQMQVDIVADGAGLATTAKQDSIIADTAAIQTAVETIDNFISGSRGLVTEDNSAAILTSVQLIDDAIFIDDTATHTTGATKGMGIMAVAVPTDTSVTANDIGMMAMSTDRRLLVDAQIVGNDGALDVSGATITVTGDAAGSLTVDNAGLTELATAINANRVDVNIAASGATVTVTGTVTANLSGTDNAVLDAIALSLAGLDDSVDGNYLNVNANIAGVDFVGGAGVVAAGVQRTTLASNDPAVAKLGTIDTDTGNMATSLANIDNAVDGNYLDTNMNIAGTDVVGGAGVLAAGVQRVTIATDDEVNNLLGTIDADTGAIKLAVEKIDGAISGPGDPSIDSYTQFAINLSSGTNQVLVASAPNKQIWVYGVVYTCSVDGTVSFQDEDDVAITGIMDHAANSGLSHQTSGNFAMPIWKLATDKDLEVDVVTAAIDGWLNYAIVSV